MNIDNIQTSKKVHVQNPFVEVAQEFSKYRALIPKFPLTEKTLINVEKIKVIRGTVCVTIPENDYMKGFEHRITNFTTEGLKYWIDTLEALYLKNEYINGQLLQQTEINPNSCRQLEYLCYQSLAEKKACHAVLYALFYEKISTDDFSANLMLATAFKFLGDIHEEEQWIIKKALEHARKAHQLKPEELRALEIRSLLERDLFNFAEHMSCEEEIIKKLPEDQIHVTRLIFLYSSLLHRKDYLIKAIANERRYLKAQPRCNRNSVVENIRFLEIRLDSFVNPKKALDIVRSINSETVINKKEYLGLLFDLLLRFDIKEAERIAQLKEAQCKSKDDAKEVREDKIALAHYQNKHFSAVVHGLYYNAAIKDAVKYAKISTILQFCRSFNSLTKEEYAKLTKKISDLHEIVDEGLKFETDNYNFLYTRANLYYTLGYTDEAIQAYNQYLKQYPQYRSDWFRELYRIHMSIPENKKIADLYLKKYKEATEIPHTKTFQQLNNELTKSSIKTEIILEILSEQYKKDKTECHFAEYFKALKEFSDRKQVQNICNEHLRHNSASFPALLSCVDDAYISQDYAKAITIATKVIDSKKYEPNIEIFHCLRGNSYYSIGNYLEAVTDLRIGLTSKKYLNFSIKFYIHSNLILKNLKLAESLIKKHEHLLGNEKAKLVSNLKELKIQDAINRSNAKENKLLTEAEFEKTLAERIQQESFDLFDEETISVDQSSSSLNLNEKIKVEHEEEEYERFYFNRQKAADADINSKRIAYDKLNKEKDSPNTPEPFLKKLKELLNSKKEHFELPPFQQCTFDPLSEAVPLSDACEKITVEAKKILKPASLQIVCASVPMNVVKIPEFNEEVYKHLEIARQSLVQIEDFFNRMRLYSIDDPTSLNKYIVDRVLKYNLLKLGEALFPTSIPKKISKKIQKLLDQHIIPYRLLNSMRNKIRHEFHLIGFSDLEEFCQHLIDLKVLENIKKLMEESKKDKWIHLFPIKPNPNFFVSYNEFSLPEIKYAINDLNRIIELYAKRGLMGIEENIDLKQAIKMSISNVEECIKKNRINCRYSKLVISLGNAIGHVIPSNPELYLPEEIQLKRFHDFLEKAATIKEDIEKSQIHEH